MFIYEPVAAHADGTVVPGSERRDWSNLVVVAERGLTLGLRAQHQWAVMDAEGSKRKSSATGAIALCKNN